MKPDNANILGQPIEDLALSQECISHLKDMGLGKLGDLALLGWQGLIASNGFDYLWFNELVRFLDKHDLLHLMEK